MGRRGHAGTEAYAHSGDGPPASEKALRERGGDHKQRTKAAAQNLPAARGAAGHGAGSRRQGPEAASWRAEDYPVDATTSAAPQVKKEQRRAHEGATPLYSGKKNQRLNKGNHGVGEADSIAAWLCLRQAGPPVGVRRRLPDEKLDSPEEEGRVLGPPSAEADASAAGSATPDGDAGGGAGGATGSRQTFYGCGIKDPIARATGGGSGAAGGNGAGVASVAETLRLNLSSGTGARGGGSADAGAGVGARLCGGDGGDRQRGSHSSSSSSCGGRRPIGAGIAAAAGLPDEEEEEGEGEAALEAEDEGSEGDGSGLGEGKGQASPAAIEAKRGKGGHSVWFFGADGAEDSPKEGAKEEDAKDGAKDGAKEGGASPKKEKGKGKGKKGPKNLTMMSRALSIILRHRAEKLGVRIRPDGFCPLTIILNLEPMRELKVTHEDIVAVVRDNDKKRFEIETIDGETWIRAVQGHSMKAVQDEELLQRLHGGSVPDTCVHGTYRRFLESILDKGLVAGGSGEGRTNGGGRNGKGHGGKWHRGYGRNHIHFVAYDEWNAGNRQIISGMRGDCDVAIIVDLPLAIEAGIPFYRSKNEVILSPGVKGVLSPRYFVEAKCTRTGNILWSHTQPLESSSGT